MPQPKSSIVLESNFIIATRETGYRSTTAAVSELIDNAIEANASEIHVLVFEGSTGPTEQFTFAVLDNGVGMDQDILHAALRFGGTARFNSRSGLGRFGMGLPNSSVSQCRRVEVYSWRSHAVPYYTYLDVDEICSGSGSIPEPLAKQLPEWAQNLACSSGTLVVWTRCDRVNNRRLSTVVHKLHSGLGRKFRYALISGTNIIINAQPVRPLDPLYCHTSSVLTGAQEYCAPLEYHIRSGAPGTNQFSLIRVRFSLLPVKDWHKWPIERKREYGISGGAGVSVVRAGREIAQGWYFLRGKRKQNYDDWWRCEVSFEPALDEWFGVTHSKQGINPIQDLNDVLTRDMVAIANKLNAQIRKEFAEIKTEPQHSSAKMATSKDWRLPPVVASEIHMPVSQQAPNEVTLMSDVQYQLKIGPQASREFFSWKMEGKTLSLEINQDHPFFDKVYQPLVDGVPQLRSHHLECILLALARAEAQYPAQERLAFKELREFWSDALLAFLT